MRIIAIANQKGGCGKTTTAINLSAALAHLKKNILLIDLDPQAHATLGLNIKPEDLTRTMYDVLTPLPEEKIRLDEIIIPISDNFDLAPSNILLSAIEQELSGKPEREAKLFQAISLMVTRKTYDYIIIDCSPSLGLLTFNGLRCAQEVIAPVETGFFSLHGVSRLTETVNLINRHLPNKIKVKALITMFDRRTKFAREIKEQIDKFFSGQVFNAIIHNNVRLKEASSYGLPVITYDKRCRGCEDYSNLAKEVAGDISQMQPVRVEEDVRFLYHNPLATSVGVAGDFNNWIATQESELENTEKGVWAKVCRLKPGRYRYKFIVDGRWITDPNNPNIQTDEFGNINSLLEIK